MVDHHILVNVLTLVQNVELLVEVVFAEAAHVAEVTALQPWKWQHVAMNSAVMLVAYVGWPCSWKGT